MTEKAYFFDSVDGDKIYYSTDLAKVFMNLTVDGIVPYIGDRLKCSLEDNGKEITMGTGASWIQGRLYINESPKTFQISDADPVHTRLDLLVLRLDLNIGQRKIEAVIKEGDPSAAPESPLLQQDSLIYEVPIYMYYIGPEGIDGPHDIRDYRAALYATTALNRGVYNLRMVSGGLAIEVEGVE